MTLLPMLHRTASGGARGARRWRSLKMNVRSKHSDLADLTHRSAIALARGDLNGVRICVMPRWHNRRSKMPCPYQ
jgi:hypothetical protein